MSSSVETTLYGTDHYVGNVGTTWIGRNNSEVHHPRVHNTLVERNEIEQVRKVLSPGAGSQGNGRTWSVGME